MSLIRHAAPGEDSRMILLLPRGTEVRIYTGRFISHACSHCPMSLPCVARMSLPEAGHDMYSFTQCPRCQTITFREKKHKVKVYQGLSEFYEVLHVCSVKGRINRTPSDMAEFGIRDAHGYGLCTCYHHNEDGRVDKDLRVQQGELFVRMFLP